MQVWWPLHIFGEISALYERVTGQMHISSAWILPILPGNVWCVLGVCNLWGYSCELHPQWTGFAGFLLKEAPQISDTRNHQKPEWSRGEWGIPLFNQWEDKHFSWTVQPMICNVKGKMLWMHHALSCPARKLKCNSSNAVVIQRDFPGLHFRKKARHKNLRDDYQNSMRNLSHLRLQANNVSGNFREII